MDIGVIAKRYAKALLVYAKEQHAEDRVYNEILMFAQSYRKIPEVKDVLSNPLLPTTKKVSILCQAASTDVGPVYRKFAQLVVEHHRESIMIFIAHAYVSLYREEKHISIGHLITAVPVSDKESDRLENWVEKKAMEMGEATDLIMDKHVDPNILGGFIFEVDDLRLDVSVRSQFERIKKQFIEKNKRII